MSRSDQTVQVTVRLSKDSYEQVKQAAHAEKCPVEDLLGRLIAQGLEAHMTLRDIWDHMTLRDIWDRVSQDYRARLARSGKLSQSAETVRQELRTLREQIARDLYPG